MRRRIAEGGETGCERRDVTRCGTCFGGRWRRHRARSGFSINDRMSSTRQTEILDPSRTCRGYRPCFTPSHQLDLLIGMQARIVGNLTNPVSGRDVGSSLEGDFSQKALRPPTGFNRAIPARDVGTADLICNIEQKNYPQFSAFILLSGNWTPVSARAYASRIESFRSPRAA
jgi:hypothetical protein